MKNITQLKTSQKILIVPVIVVILVAAIFLSTQIGGSGGTLSDAIEGGELALSSVGRNYESLTQFVQSNEMQSLQLLQAARAALDNSKAKLNTVQRTDDEYVLGMLDNYERVSQASAVMSQGVDNLLVISENLTNAINYYFQKDYGKAAEQASYCLPILTPLINEFGESATVLNGIDAVYVPSGQRDRLTLGVGQYRNEMGIYNVYVGLLQSILEGKDYLQINAQLEDYLMQLQSALANNDYQKAQDLRQKISQILQSLQDSKYQNAADTASQLDPSLLSGTASDVAEELQNRLRNLEGIDAFQNYLQSLQKYMDALRLLEQGDKEGAAQIINEELGNLEQYQGGDPELQGLYGGLREAFMHLRDPPKQG